MKIIQSSWQEHKVALQHIRQNVFIDEQQVAIAEEWDENDASALHYLVEFDEKAVACARMLVNQSTAKIGRVAVLKDFRRQGIASQLMQHIECQAIQLKLTLLSLDAQCYIKGFYQKLGYQVCSNEFIDAGIPHIAMQKQLSKPENC